MRPDVVLPVRARLIPAKFCAVRSVEAEAMLVSTSSYRYPHLVTLVDVRVFTASRLATVERVRWGIIGVGDVTEGKSGPGFSGRSARNS